VDTPTPLPLSLKPRFLGVFIDVIVCTSIYPLSGVRVDSKYNFRLFFYLLLLPKNGTNTIYWICTFKSQTTLAVIPLDQAVGGLGSQFIY
jgi:hypothetical protein